jgi:putative endonuclease
VGIAAGALGALGERVAERWLVGRGWRVLARRYRVGHRDIDLIVRRDHVVAFVEVKTRYSPGFGGPVCAVGRGKRRHLWRAATIWIDRYGAPDLEYRFDVIGVLASGGLIRIAHLENAFTVEHAR